MGLLTTNAIVDMLKEDHKKVKRLFEDFKEAEGREKTEIAKTAIQELEVHAELEERLTWQSAKRSMRRTR